MTEQQKQLMIRIVSISSWVFAVFCLAVIGFLAPSLSDQAEPDTLRLFIVFVALMLLYSLIGWGLGRRKLWAGIIALVIYGLNLLSNILAVASTPKVIIGVVIGLTMLALMILGWKALK